MGIGSHQSARAGSQTWLTPQPIIDALGGWQSFDLDPCAAPAPRPWFTAWQHNAERDGDGLALDWFGRVWLNFPYGDPGAWLRKMVAHNQGTVLMFARTETDPSTDTFGSMRQGCFSCAADCSFIIRPIPPYRHLRSAHVGAHEILNPCLAKDGAKGLHTAARGEGRSEPSAT